MTSGILALTEPSLETTSILSFSIFTALESKPQWISARLSDIG